MGIDTRSRLPSVCVQEEPVFKEYVDNLIAGACARIACASGRECLCECVDDRMAHVFLQPRKTEQ